jgi:hypothetical protein
MEPGLVSAPISLPRSDAPLEVELHTTKSYIERYHTVISQNTDTICSFEMLVKNAKPAF